MIGHSERRLILGETDAVINKKVNTACAAGLQVILCIGETLEQRQQNKTEAVVESQLQGSLAGITLDPSKITLAYERVGRLAPVWLLPQNRRKQCITSSASG